MRMPISITIAKFSTLGPPNRNRPSIASAVTTEVMIVRDSVVLIERSITSAGSSFDVARNTSRIRSKTTTLSLME